MAKANVVTLRPAEAGAKGGLARAQSLSAEERRIIAKRAADARWNQADGQEPYPRVTHRGVLTVGEVGLPCFVLADGRRVISGRGMTAAIGMKGRGQGAQRIGEHRSIKPHLSKDLALAISRPILFLGGSPRGNAPSSGFEATVLQELCEALLLARDAGMLQTAQERRYAQYADMLIRAFARVGIIALVDEATGYQEVRARDELHRILEFYIAKELLPWTKRFPDEFFKEMFRVWGWPWPPSSYKGPLGPRYAGKLIRQLIYENLPPGVLEELDRMKSA